MTTETGEKQLRTFGFTVGGIFAVLGVWPFIFRHGEPRLWAFVLAGVLVLPALVVPKSLGPIYQVWMTVGHVLGWINTRLILSVMFYGLFTPFGLVMRRVRKDPMHMRFEPDAETYRITRQARPANHITRQF